MSDTLINAGIQITVDDDNALTLSNNSTIKAAATISANGDQSGTAIDATNGSDSNATLSALNNGAASAIYAKSRNSRSTSTQPTVQIDSTEGGMIAFQATNNSPTSPTVNVGNQSSGTVIQVTGHGTSEGSLNIINLKGPAMTLSQYGASPIPQLNMVTGAVHSDASCGYCSKYASGDPVFTVSKAGTGTYQITFNCFAVNFNIVVTPYSLASSPSQTCFCQAYDFSSNSVYIQISDQNGDAVDYDFNFIAMGQ